MALSAFADEFPPSSLMISHELGAALEDVARRLQIPFLNAADFAMPSSIDSLHLDAEGHNKIAHAIADKIGGILA
jgi:lysophospholipase L1-like esterase